MQQFTFNFKSDSDVEPMINADSSIIEENEDGNSLQDVTDNDGRIPQI